MLTLELITAYKRRNSTLQPDFTAARSESVALKTPTSEEAPSFLLNWEEGAFPYNYARWGSRYYWVNNVTYERNNLVRIDCTLDVLATYKLYILASTQFVAYSSVSGGVWLPDRRIALTEETTSVRRSANLPNMLASGIYVLTTLGSTGCEMYAITYGDLKKLINNVQNRAQAFQANVMNDFDPGSAADVNEALYMFADVLTQTDMLGNAFENAPSCIRSCIWLPFREQNIDQDVDIYLGLFNTGVQGRPITKPNFYNTINVPIPWQYSDWRRMTCEDVYLYLPFVGVINLDPTQLGESSDTLHIDVGFGYADGNVCYEVAPVSNNVYNRKIGTYGGSCAAQIPLGINQTASYGQIAHTAIEGIRKTAGSLAGGSIPSVSAATNAVLSGIEVADVSYSTNPTIIGGVGGGAASLLDLSVSCWTVAHKTVINPGEQMATMGVPTQKPLQLSSCSGYCQCVNAHVAAPAHGDSLNAIDIFLNSGFFIE